MGTNLIAKKEYSIPFIIWIIAGTVIPLASIAYYGFTSRDGGFTLDNVLAIFRHDHMQALLLSLLSLSVLFTAISMVIKSRAGTMVICVAFVFSFGIFSMMAGNYSYNHQMIEEYEELYNEALENAPEGYYDLSDMEFDKSRYFNTGWFIGHPLFVATNATLGSEFEPTLSSMIMNESLITGENMFEYPKTITRLPFVNSYYSMFTGNYGAFMVDRDDLNDITGAVVTFERAELEYNIKSIVWSAIYFGAGYLIFRKKNVF